MTRKHTKGPWHVQDNDGAYCMVRAEPEPQFSNGGSIAKVWLQGSDYNDANACLIAAAPELLEALESIFLKLTFEHVTDWRQMRREIGEIAGHAIAKAEGLQDSQAQALMNRR